MLLAKEMFNIIYCDLLNRWFIFLTFRREVGVGGKTVSASCCEDLCLDLCDTLITVLSVLEVSFYIFFNSLCIQGRKMHDGSNKNGIKQ